MRIPDNLDLYNMREREQERLKKLRQKREWEENKEEESEKVRYKSETNSRNYPD